MVTPVKVERVRRAAQAWLAGHPEAAGLRVRFDVAAELTGRLGVVQDAF
jgi:Holliday junction resolvase-like predicted endonuclease